MPRAASRDARARLDFWLRFVLTNTSYKAAAPVKYCTIQACPREKELGDFDRTRAIAWLQDAVRQLEWLTGFKFPTPSSFD